MEIIAKTDGNVGLSAWRDSSTMVLAPAPIAAEVMITTGNTKQINYFRIPFK